MYQVRLYAQSPDGARIPVTLIYPKTTQLNGNNPTVLVAHGSFGVSLGPAFEAMQLAWLERGGVIAIAHVRGGGEFGKTWHDTGRGEAKLNAIRDCIAAAQFLSSYGFTSPKRLALAASGAGAIAVAGAMVRRPDLATAVVLRAPLSDLTSIDASIGGAALAHEFGQDLAAVSPYDNVRDATPYPAVLVTAGGDDDDGAAPWQAVKLAARLEAATSSGKPVLLRVDSDALPDREARALDLADLYSFLLWQLGDPAFQPKPPAPPPAPAPSQPTPAVQQPTPAIAQPTPP
jgi:prolyl oligopeptidase